MYRFSVLCLLGFRLIVMFNNVLDCCVNIDANDIYLALQLSTFETDEFLAIEKNYNSSTDPTKVVVCV